MEYPPCINPHCKSHGKSHPNCQCYGPMADGGEVTHFCDSKQTHKEGCEYFRERSEHFAEGGAVDFTPDAQQAPQGQIDFQPDDQTAAAEAKYGDVRGMAKTAALGAMEGLAGPFGTAAMNQVGVGPEEQEGLKKANPGTYYGTFGAGLIGPAAIGYEGPSQANVVAKGATAVAEALGFEGVAKVATKMSVENALLAVSSELSKTINQDPSTIQQAVTHVGLSSILGGVGGAIFGKAGELWTSKLGPKAEEFAASFQGGLNKLSDAPKDLPSYEHDYYEPIKNLVRPSAPLDISQEGLDAAKGITPAPTPSPVGQKFADFIHKKAVDAASELMSDTAGSLAGSLSGIPGGRYIGAMIGHYALKPMVKTIMPTLLKPILEAAPSGEGLRAAFQAIGAVAKGDALINEVSKGLFQTGNKALFDQLSPDKYKLDSLSKRVDSLSQNQEAMMNVGGSIGHYLPQHQIALAATAQNAVTYLSSQKPRPYSGLALDKPLQPTPAGAAVYNRTLGIAEQPLSILGRVKSGTVSPKDIQDLKALYPSLHAAMAQKIVQHMVEHMAKDGTIPYRTRAGLSTFLGQPMDSTFTQPAIMAAQLTHMPKQPPQQPQGEARKKKGASAISKSVKMAQTPLESRQEALNKA